jgi:hypothetical protein
MPERELIYTEEEFPHGLMCSECDHIFTVEGEAFSYKLISIGDDKIRDVVLIVCTTCGLNGVVA